MSCLKQKNFFLSFQCNQTKFLVIDIYKIFFNKEKKHKLEGFSYLVFGFPSSLQSKRKSKLSVIHDFARSNRCIQYSSEAFISHTNFN